MADIYGLRTRDESNRVTLDTSVTPIRSLKMMQVTGDGSYNQYFSVPDIKASSFVVVDSLLGTTGSTWSPQAFWTDGQLHLRGAGTRQWQVMILSNGTEPFSAIGEYGFRSRNNGILNQVDSANRVLGVRYSGSFEFGVYWRPGMREQVSGGFYYPFPEPVTTFERPLVFLNAEDYMMVTGFYVTGGPGNWTGWGIDHLGIYYRYHGLQVSDYMKMKWFLASYQTRTSSAGLYGVLLRDASGNRVFASTDNIALLNSQPSSNSFYNDGEPIEVGTTYQSSTRMPWTSSFGDYVLANALFSNTNIQQTQNPIITNWGGFLPGNRSIIKMYARNYANSPATGISANGRTLFASRPMKNL